MKIWNKMRFPLLLLLITVLCALLQTLIQTWDVMQGIFLIPIFMSAVWFDYRYVFTDLIVLCICLGCAMWVPAFGKLRRTRRYLLRPVLLAVVVFAVSIPVIGFVQAQQEELEDRRQAEKIAHAYQLIEEADEIFYYNLSTHYQPSAPSAPEVLTHCCGYGHDMILVDYDTHSVTFLQSPEHAGEIDTFILLPAGSDVSERHIQVDVALSKPGARLITYFPDLDNPHRTCGITLVMSDGSVYAVTDLVEPRSGYVLFLDLHRDHPVGDSHSCPYAD